MLSQRFFYKLLYYKKLKKHKITMVDTVRQSRKQISEEIELDKEDEIDRVQHENPKDILKQGYFIMKPKEALTQVIKCSGAKTVKAASGK